MSFLLSLYAVHLLVLRGACWILFSFASLSKKVFIGQWRACIVNNREGISYAHAHLCFSTHGLHIVHVHYAFCITSSIVLPRT